MNIPIAPDATEDHDLDWLNVSNVFEIEPSRDEPSEDKGEDELLPPIETEIDSVEAMRRLYYYHDRVNDLAMMRDTVLEKPKKEIERIQDWYETETNNIMGNRIKYYETILFIFIKILRKENPKFKVSTPYGKAFTKKNPPKWNWNEERVIETLNEISPGQYTERREVLKKAEIKKSFKVQEVDSKLVPVMYVT